MPPPPRLDVGVFCILWLPFLTSGWRVRTCDQVQLWSFIRLHPGVSQVGLPPTSVSAGVGDFDAVRGSTIKVEMVNRN